MMVEVKYFFFRKENEANISDHPKITGKRVECKDDPTDHWQPWNWAPGSDEYF